MDQPKTSIMARIKSIGTAIALVLCCCIVSAQNSAVVNINPTATNIDLVYNKIDTGVIYSCVEGINTKLMIHSEGAKSQLVFSVNNHDFTIVVDTNGVFDILKGIDLGNSIIAEFNKITSFGATLTTSTTVSPNNMEMLAVSAASNDVTLTINPENLCNGCQFKVHVTDLDATFDVIFAVTGSANGYRYIDNITASNFTLLDGSGNEGIYDVYWNATDQIFKISR